MLITYRRPIYSLAMKDSGVAIDLGLSLSDRIAMSRETDWVVRRRRPSRSGPQLPGVDHLRFIVVNVRRR